jgi:hypothetical protein
MVNLPTPASNAPVFLRQRQIYGGQEPFIIKNLLLAILESVT